MTPRFRLFVLALLVPAGLSGCATSTNLVTGESQRSAYTWQQELQLGREADGQIIAQFGLYDNAGLAAYVNRVGQDVLATSAYSDAATPAEIRQSPFTFRVLNSPVVNAFALPGGYIYVTRGLLAHLNNEAQLAVVLGHEIGHVLGRHASRRAATAQLGQLGVLGAAVLGEAVIGRGAGEAIVNYGGTGVGLLFLRYGRDDEREADRAGVAYAEFAGYEGSEGADLFDSLARISQESGQSVPGFLSTHPDPGERQATIPQLAAQYQPGGTEVRAREYLQQIDGIILGEDPREGFTEGATFYHPEFRFRFDFPQGWRVNNGAQAVQIAEPNGRAALQFTLAQGGSAQAAAQTFAGQQGVQATAPEATRVNGNRAYRLTAQANTQSGQIGALAYFIEYDGRVYQFVGLAPVASFQQERSAMERAIQSFDRLTEQRYLSRQPVRLDFVQAPRAGTFSSFLNDRPDVPGLTESGLAILNQVDLTTPVPAGAALKLPAR